MMSQAAATVYLKDRERDTGGWWKGWMEAGYSRLVSSGVADNEGRHDNKGAKTSEHV